MSGEHAVDGVIFDLDGTLVDSLPAIARAMQEALRLYRIEKTIEEVYPIIGPPIETMAAQLGASEDNARLIGVEYRRLYDGEYVKETVPLPGAEELLDALDAARTPYAIVTNKREYSGRQAVNVVGWSERVRALAGRDTPGSAEKPDPAAAAWGLAALGITAERAAFVGDTEFDMQCAHGAGIAFVIGITGARTHEELFEAGATHVVDSLLDIVPLLLGVGVAQ